MDTTVKSSAPDRVTVALGSRVSEEVRRLREWTGLTKTELINRALSLYFFSEQLRSEGKQLAVYDPKRDEFQRVHVA